MSGARLHPLPLLTGVLVAVLTAQLGNWQVGRALEKSAMQAKFESVAMSRAVPLGLVPPEEWQTVELRGTWRPERSILLDNRVHRGRVGYHVLTPLELAGAQRWVLVNRGWVAAGTDRGRLPAVGAPPGERVVAGRIRHASDKAFTLAADDGAERVWQVLDLPRYRERSGLPVADFVVQQAGGTDDGLVRDWPRPDAGADRHRGYALQWYALAALAAGLTGWYVWNGLWRTKRDNHHPVRSDA